MEINKESLQKEKDRQTAVYQSVLSCFKYGRANAIHMKDLQRYSGLDNRRLRKVIELIRRDGVCVCSDEAGYYLPETAAELEKYIKRVERTAKSTFFTLKTARTELAKMNNAEQISVDEIGGEKYVKEETDTD